MTNLQYMELSKQFPVGYTARKRDCEELLREEHQGAVAKLIKKEMDDSLRLNVFRFHSPDKEFSKAANWRQSATLNDL